MRPNSIDDVWKNIPVGEKDTCWLWRGTIFPAGYGRSSINQTSLGAHVAAYKAANGEIPDGMYVLHKCNNKRCCNPNHLTIGTNSDNQRHASASGAWPVGMSGIRGVTFDATRKYWIASGYRDGRRRNLYTGPHKKKAITARMKWEAENLITFKESNHGI